MMTLSTVLSGHESGVKTLTTAKVTAAQTTLTTACQKWSSSHVLRPVGTARITATG